MKIIQQLAFMLVAATIFPGCVTIPADFVQPGVTVVSVAPRDWNSLTPEFEIVLRVTNPNRTPLKIAGLSYTVHLEGNKVIEGVASKLPKIAAYGEEDVTLQAAADLFGGLNLLAGLLAAPSNQIGFEFNAQIDLGTFHPMININKTGAIAVQ